MEILRMKYKNVTMFEIEGERKRRGKFFRANIIREIGQNSWEFEWGKNLSEKMKMELSGVRKMKMKMGRSGVE